MALMLMAHESDPKTEIQNKLKSYVDDFHITGAQVLIGIYVRPEKTKGGIILTDKYRDEDRFQGKAGLILKMGPMTLNDDDKQFFGDKLPQVGDWVLFRPSDGFPVQFPEDKSCRLLEDVRRIKAIIQSPDTIW